MAEYEEHKDVNSCYVRLVSLYLLSVCLSVRLFVTFVLSIEMAKPNINVIKQSTLTDSRMKNAIFDQYMYVAILETIQNTEIQYYGMPNRKSCDSGRLSN